MGEGGLRRALVVASIWTVAWSWSPPAQAYEPGEEFRKGAIVITPQIGGGTSNNVEENRTHTDLSFINSTIRFSAIPWDPVSEGFWKGALEAGLEPWVQVYVIPSALSEGVKGVARYHFLRVAPIFPYIELSAGVGATSLNIREIRSDFAFVLEGGAGLGYFVRESIALTAGYRFQHISNGGIESPNRGVNSDTGVAGVSFFFH